MELASILDMTSSHAKRKGLSSVQCENTSPRWTDALNPQTLIARSASVGVEISLVGDV
jgi:hypothetical protein